MRHQNPQRGNQQEYASLMRGDHPPKNELSSGGWDPITTGFSH